MDQLGLKCKLMVVKGDGTLLQADYARTRAVETVLSGPAASLNGAAFLAKYEDVMVADIGGTTTDISRLRGGVMQISKDGAVLGGWRTNVGAAHVRTFGLGGDSVVTVNRRGLKGGVSLGPRRALPLSLLSLQQPQILEVLRQQTKEPISQATHGHFVQAMVAADAVPNWLSRSETKLLNRLTKTGVAPLTDIAPTQVALGTVDKLITRDLMMLSCFTPTDALHVLGRFDKFDSRAAELGAWLLAHQKTGAGLPLADNEKEAAQMVIDALTDQSAIALMDAAMADDRAADCRKTEKDARQIKSGQFKNDTEHNDYPVSSSNVLRGVLTDRQNWKKINSAPRAAVEISLKLSIPLVALGASAAAYFPAIANRLGAELSIPNHAEVAGAVGAAAGAVRQRAVVLITQPSEGVYRVHLSEGPQDIKSRNKALAMARGAAKTAAKARAKAAGASAELEVSVSETIDEVSLGPNKTLFLQATIIGEASDK